MSRLRAFVFQTVMTRRRKMALAIVVPAPTEEVLNLKRPFRISYQVLPVLKVRLAMTVVVPCGLYPPVPSNVVGGYTFSWAFETVVSSASAAIGIGGRVGT